MDLFLVMAIMIGMVVFLQVVAPYSIRRMFRNNFAFMFAIISFPLIFYLVYTGGLFDDGMSVAAPGPDFGTEPMGGGGVTEPVIEQTPMNNYNYENETELNFTLSFEDTLTTEDLLGGI